MSRVAQILTSKLTIAAVAIIVAAGAVGAGVAIHDKNNGNVQTTSNTQHQLTQISYNGQAGVNALALLRKHATVQTKKYSFGLFVESIDGVNGNGPKYWTFYVN